MVRLWAAAARSSARRARLGADGSAGWGRRAASGCWPSGSSALTDAQKAHTDQGDRSPSAPRGMARRSASDTRSPGARSTTRSRRHARRGDDPPAQRGCRRGPGRHRGRPRERPRGDLQLAAHRRSADHGWRAKMRSKMKARLRGATRQGRARRRRCGPRRCRSDRAARPACRCAESRGRRAGARSARRRPPPRPRRRRCRPRHSDPRR